MKNNKNIYFILPSIITFSISIIYFFIVLGINYYDNKEEIFIKSLSESSFILLIFSALSFPGFILHFRYIFLNKNFKIIFHKKHFEILKENEAKIVLYTEVNKIEMHSTIWKSRNPWSDYGYVKIILESGEKIFYNSLTNIENSENILLSIERIKKYSLEDIYPWH